jgi:hypothetical protein
MASPRRDPAPKEQLPVRAVKENVAGGQGTETSRFHASRVIDELNSRESGKALQRGAWLPARFWVCRRKDSDENRDSLDATGQDMLKLSGCRQETRAAGMGEHDQGRTVR